MNNVISIDEQFLNEAFFMPFGLHTVAELGNQKLYGSAKLNAKFIEAVSTTDAGVPITGKVAQLVNEVKVVPCFVNKGILGFLAWKIFTPIGYKSILAFYTQETKKIYIILTNNSSLLFGYANNLWMTLLLIHECQHMAAHDKPSQFTAMFIGDLNKFYSEYFKTLFELRKDPDNTILTSFIDLISKFELLDAPDVVKKVKDFGEIKSILEELSKSSLMTKRSIEDLIELYRAAIVSLATGKLFDDVATQYRAVLPVVKPLYIAYKKAFGMKGLNTLAIQELIYPSEVIAIASERALISKGQQSIKQLL
jgi:hypothetical protein